MNLPQFDVQGNQSGVSIHPLTLIGKSGQMNYVQGTAHQTMKIKKKKNIIKKSIWSWNVLLIPNLFLIIKSTIIYAFQFIIKRWHLNNYLMVYSIDLILSCFALHTCTNMHISIALDIINALLNSARVKWFPKVYSTGTPVVLQHGHISQMFYGVILNKPV